MFKPMGIDSGLISNFSAERSPTEAPTQQPIPDLPTPLFFQGAVELSTSPLNERVKPLKTNPLSLPLPLAAPHEPERKDSPPNCGVSHDHPGLEKFKGKISADSLKAFMAYLASRDSALINCENALDLLLLAKDQRESELSMQCLKCLLNTKNASLDHIDHEHIYKEKILVRALLKEAKKNAIAISRNDDGVAHIRIAEGSREQQWKCLKQIHELIPITHLEFSPPRDYAYVEYPESTVKRSMGFLLLFLQSNQGLVSLDLSCWNVEDRELEELSKHLPALKSFSIQSAKLTAIPPSICNQIERLSCEGCPKLTTLCTPLATEVGCWDCLSLTTLDAPTALKIRCDYCYALTTLNAPLALKIFCENCHALTTLNAPLAISIKCKGCKTLTTLHAPLAAKIYCDKCFSLTTLNAPAALEIVCRACSLLTTLNAPLAILIRCKECPRLITLHAPVAAAIDCSHCSALRAIDSPKAIEIRCHGCVALTTLNIPAALVLGCEECEALTSEVRLEIFTLLRRNIMMTYYTNVDQNFPDLEQDFPELMEQAGEVALITAQNHFSQWLIDAGSVILPPHFESEAQELDAKHTTATHLEELLLLAHAEGIIAGGSLTWFKDAERLNTVQQQMKRMMWLAALLGCSSPEKNPLADPDALPALKAISNLTNPFLQREATRALLSMYDDGASQKLEMWKALNTKIKKHQILPCLLLSNAALGEKSIQNLLDSLASVHYKNKAILTPILEMICMLSLPAEQSERVLNLILKAPTKGIRERSCAFQKRLEQYRKEQPRRVVACRDLLFFEKTNLLIDLADGNALLAKHKLTSQEFFSIKEEFIHQFVDAFASKRYPYALSTYVARLQTLPQEEKALLAGALGTFVNALLEGTFPQIRYDLSINPHLAVIFKDNPALLEKWMMPLSIEVAVGKPSESTAPHEIVKRLMGNAIDNDHLGNNSAAIYQTLAKVLKMERWKTELLTLLEHGLCALKKSGGSEGTQKRLDFEIACLKALDPHLALTERIDILRSLLKKSEKLPGASEFKHDVMGIIDAIQLAKTAVSLLRVESTDAWEDLLLIGTEVNNSCQRVDGNPALNKGLLAYILDGKNKAIVVRDAEGKIAARSILRLLWDQERQCAVLFMEHIYTRGSALSLHALHALIRRGCKCKAKEMKLLLVASPQGFPKALPYKGVLSALGDGPAPFEYVDALHGIRANAGFSIHRSNILYMPG